ncbi:prenyltransferase [Subsaximicrobium wynnwilliamsii]|uniref:Prenyltransferase n=1 Tax=Subsaximicrobium wynnwilliamsii TaxID=291179 RepID=A0A5C6ZKT4_9FLAO|nr:geranylgeranylglycerol-phosphate geranylgeranyltransferase [Subsaximicrobium wynnwilliamsii]TXD84768.1 prenyltransferase [Subsaximicrobium wynnwilliamsii]TXD90439.1 prenyltransferase [Subsaximicrobium wynnwilliamsii]TXE04915.1 prenyltransferase [Subsaximicrobium wynnwilliamsii]
MHLLNLIRYKNLLLIILAQVLIKYALLEPFAVLTALDGFHFSLLVLATLCLAAAGNVINDIYDVDTDRVNRPNKLIVGGHISEKIAYNLFFALNIIGVVLGFYLSNHIGKPPFFSIFVLISVSLYVYASFLKRTILFGNLLISALVGISLLIVGIFDVIPAMFPQNRQTQITFFNLIFDYAVFAFMINLLREIIKDIEDVDGDYKAGMNTLPIALGRERAKKIAFAVSMLPIAAVIYYVVTYLYHQQLVIAYFLILIVAPLIYATIKIFGAKQKQHYQHISLIYKLVMLFGVLSMLLYPFVLK